MTHLQIFVFLLLVSTRYVLWRGDRDYRIVAAISLVAVLTTQIALGPLSSRYYGTETGVLLVDLASFGGFACYRANDPLLAAVGGGTPTDHQSRASAQDD